jgi:hypothetical protein
MGRPPGWLDPYEVWEGVCDPDSVNFRVDPETPRSYLRPASGDVLQGAAADCNSAGETHAWFDSRVAHHSP